MGISLDEAKGVCLVVFFVISMTLGSLPVCLVSKYSLSLSRSKRGKRVLSYINCFAGGVFLGTCLLSVLTEGMEQFEEYQEVRCLWWSMKYGMKKNENCTILIPKGNSYCRSKCSARGPRFKVSSEGLSAEISRNWHTTMVTHPSTDQGRSCLTSAHQVVDCSCRPIPVTTVHP